MQGADNHMKIIKSAGFTVVELLVTITAGSILIWVFYNSLLSAYLSVTSFDKQTRAVTDIKRALLDISDDTVLATDYLTAVPSDYYDPYGPHRLGTSSSEAWSYAGDSADSRVLIIKSISTTQNGGGSARRPVYINTAAYNCTTTMASQPKLSYISIYFVYQTKLYKRLLTDKSKSLCPGQNQYQLQTCPPDINRLSWPADCEAKDEILASNVSKFSISYYQSSAVPGGTLVTGQYTSTDSTVLQLANVATITIEENIAGLSSPVSITQSFARIN